MNKIKDMAILVVSCDKYSDLWIPFFLLLKKNWEDCFYDIYLGANNISTLEIDDIKVINVGEDISWAENVKQMLKQIKAPYVLVMLEDFFIDRKVDAVKVQKCLEFAKDNHVDCLRLEPGPPGYKIVSKELGIRRLKPGAHYYVSTQPAVWKKDVLMEYLSGVQSAWDFEEINSRRSFDSKDYFAAADDYVIHHLNGVERGKYYSSTIKLLEKENIEYSKSREIINNETIKNKLRYKISIIRVKYRARFGMVYSRKDRLRAV